MNATLLTPQGPGGLCVVRITGNEADLTSFDACFRPSGHKSDGILPGELRYGRLVAADGHEVDEVIVAVSCRGERLVAGHGGSVSAEALLTVCREIGAVCTRAGGSSGHLERLFNADTAIEEEADHILPACRTEMQVALLLAARRDLAGEVRRFVRENDASGLKSLANRYATAKSVLATHRVVLAGAPNVGKSSLFNRLVDEDRVMVSDIPGTTRDLVEETIDLAGWCVALRDGAGLRKQSDAIEAEAHARSESAIQQADLAVLVLDASHSLTEDDRKAANRVKSRPHAVVLNKMDQLQVVGDEEIAALLPGARVVKLSSLADDAADRFTSGMVPLFGPDWTGEAVPFTARQAELIDDLAEGLDDPATRDRCLAALLGSAQRD